MTRSEATAFLALVQKATEGYTTHSASTELADGSHLGVTVLSKEQEQALEVEQADLQHKREAYRK